MHLLPNKIISVPLNKLAYTQILAVVALMVWELKTTSHTKTVDFP